MIDDLLKNPFSVETFAMPDPPPEDDPDQDDDEDDTSPPNQ